MTDEGGLFKFPLQVSVAVISRNLSFERLDLWDRTLEHLDFWSITFRLTNGYEPVSVVRTMVDDEEPQAQNLLRPSTREYSNQ
jgi:hypothetical protein